MKRIILILVSCTMVVSNIIAQNNSYNMVITLANGSTVSIGANEIKNISFNDGQISMDGQKLDELVKSYATTADVETAIAEVKTALQQLKDEVQSLKDKQDDNTGGQDSPSDQTTPTDNPSTTPVDDNPGNYDITQHISAYYSGGTVSQYNDLIRSGSQLNWTFVNSSNYNVTLTGIVLIDGVKGTESNNLLKENAEVLAGKSTTFSITVGILGISSPKVRFSYIYDGKVYATEAVYKKFDFPF